MYAETGRLASALKTKPDVPEVLYEYCTAWLYLNQARQITMAGPSAVPMSEIVACADIMGFKEQEDKEAFLFLIEEMESAWLTKVHEKRKKKDGA